MSNKNTGIYLENSELYALTHADCGAIASPGQYRYVMYDRREGPMRAGAPLYLRDYPTYEVTTKVRGNLPFVGVAIATMDYPWWHRVLWALQGFPERGKWSPIRFCFM